MLWRNALTKLRGGSVREYKLTLTVNITKTGIELMSRGAPIS